LRLNPSPPLRARLDGPAGRPRQVGLTATPQKGAFPGETPVGRLGLRAPRRPRRAAPAPGYPGRAK
jgi:hypothetical protein